MAKAKLKGITSIPNRHVYTRISYLYQAASYLKNSANTEHVPTRLEILSEKRDQASPKVSLKPPGSRTSRNLLTHVRGMSTKARVRLPPDVKHAICKRCDAILIPGQTSTTFIENASTNGQKPWADVLVLQCNECQTVKRFPVGQARSRRNTQNNVKQIDENTHHVDADEKTLHKDVS